MTDPDPAEPDPVEALAGQLDQLRTYVRSYATQTGQLRVTLDRHIAQVMMLLLVIKQFREQDIAQLRAQVAGITTRRRTANPPAPCWVGLSDAEYAAQLAQLRAWVDGVAPHPVARLPGSAAALLAEPSRGGLGILQPDGRVDAGVCRPQ